MTNVSFSVFTIFTPSIGTEICLAPCQEKVKLYPKRPFDLKTKCPCPQCITIMVGVSFNLQKIG